MIFGLALAAAAASHAGGTIGTSLPADFPLIIDASPGTPMLGCGASGSVARTPVIFLHSINDTPYANSTVCSTFGHIQAMAQYFADNGDDPGKLRALGDQGTQCDLIGAQTIRLGPTRVLVVRNVDASFVHLPVQDGCIAPAPAIDSFGDPTDFSPPLPGRRHSIF